MQPPNQDVKILYPAALDWGNWGLGGGEIPFSDSSLDFLHALSSRLLKDPASRTFPDVATFAFFCRRANLQALKKQHLGDEFRLGRGTAFHIAPSNVPINFAYSLVAGLLSGNRNIVRVSSTEFPQVDIIVQTIAALASEHPRAAGRIVLVRYDRASKATDIFSAACNVRIIWGGDSTIARIRQSPLAPRAFDLTFADRYSLAVINADQLLCEPRLRKLAEGFYNDTYLFDQNACSAPHLLVWLGTAQNVAAARRSFWENVHAVVKEKYELQPVMAVEKLTSFYLQAAAMPITRETSTDNLIWRVLIGRLPQEIDDFRCAGGYFSEHVATSLSEIAPIIKDNYQTLAYYGMSREQLADFVVRNRLPGLDRLVPFGQTSDFSLTWDGFDLIQTLSRQVTVL